MSLVFTDVRYYVPGDFYNYAVDNRPMQDLDANTRVLKAAFENFSGNTQILSANGDWASTSLALDVSADRGKQFTYKLSFWLVEDDTALTNAAHIIREVWTVTGLNQLTGVVTILDSNRESTRSVGTGGTVTVTYNTTANGIVVTFPGLTGSHGRIMAKVERFGY